ncbi:MAG TPA: chloride channel protein [Thermoplasmata archaeon]|nr:chloride channel protein [Thermoplasmata archaeon]
MDSISTPPTVHSASDRLGDFASANRRIFPLLVAALGIGVVAAFLAVALLDLIGFFTNLFYYGRLSFSFASPAGNSLGLLAIGVPILGGLIVGGLARFGSERIRGHGIPEAIEAILIHKSKIEPKVTVLKPVATAISIGSGGPFGAEGPIIMTGGAFGSVLGQFLRVTAVERKTLLVAGAAAGMAATFNSPLAAVLLSVELLLFEWKPRSLLPVGAAVSVATVLRWQLIGPNPLFPIPISASPSPSLLASALLLGLVAGGASALLTWSVYASEDGFRKLPIHWMWWPALGGLAIGLGGLLEPRALGVGYTSIDGLLLAQFTAEVVLGLLLVKAAIWAISLGSGTSGGVLAPLLLMGGSLGALLAVALPGGSVGLFVLLGMGAMIGGTMRAPFTGVVFSLELTHDFPALFPLLIAALAADGVTVLAMKRSILTEKVARRGVHVAREYSIDPLERIPVRSVMHTAVSLAPADLPVEDALLLSAQPGGGDGGIRLVSPEGRETGFVARRDLRSYLDSGGDPSVRVGTLALPLSSATFPDEPMQLAAERFARLERSMLPVVDPGEPGHVIGFVTREGAFEARALWNQLEQERERSLSVPGLSRGAGFWGWFERDP